MLLAATSTLVIPMLLPEMHERYFYLAEVLLVVAAFVDWRFVLPAVGIQLAGITTYLSYLANRTVVPLGWAAVVAVLAALGAAVLLVLALGRRPVGRSRQDRLPANGV